MADVRLPLAPWDFGASLGRAGDRTADSSREKPSLGTPACLVLESDRFILSPAGFKSEAVLLGTRDPQEHPEIRGP